MGNENVIHNSWENLSDAAVLMFKWHDKHRNCSLESTSFTFAIHKCHINRHLLHISGGSQMTSQSVGWQNRSQKMPLFRICANICNIIKDEPKTTEHPFSRISYNTPVNHNVKFATPYTDSVSFLCNLYDLLKEKNFPPSTRFNPRTHTCSNENDTTNTPIKRRKNYE